MLKSTKKYSLYVEYYKYNIPKTNFGQFFSKELSFKSSLEAFSFAMMILRFARPNICAILAILANLLSRELHV